MLNINEDARLYPAPAIINWHRMIVGRAHLYEGTPYQHNGRNYRGIDDIGMVLGIAYGIGRQLEDTDKNKLIGKLTPVRAPLAGDIIYMPDGMLGIIGFGRNRVITIKPDIGYTIERVPIYKSKWGFYHSKTANERYEYYCLLKGAWHHGKWDMGDS
jgi:hypothetical protein